MANPHVRPHLEFLPVDAGGYMSDAIHGSRWLKEFDPELLTPMVRHGGQDYFIFEPTVISDQSICMPFRWFKRSDQVFARAWKMQAVSYGENIGWVVLKSNEFEISKEDLVSSFPYLVHTSYHRNIPDPRKILGNSNSFLIRISNHL